MSSLRQGFAGVIILLLCIGVFAGGCGNQDQASSGETEKKFKVGFVYRTSPEKSSFDNSHELGRRHLEDQHPDIQIEVMENINPGYVGDAIYSLVAKSCEVVFAADPFFERNSYYFMKKYPGCVKPFICRENVNTGDDRSFYWGRMYQASYLMGIVAGEMTESNLIGFVAVDPDGITMSDINAFTLGARSVNPQAKVKVAWTRSRYEPEKEKAFMEKETAVANRLMDNGADIIVQYGETSAPIEAAAARGKYAMGYHSDVSAVAPNAVLTSAVWNWGAYYVKIVEDAQEGKLKPGNYLGSMSDNVVDLGPYGPMVPEEVKEKVEKAGEKIISGKWDVFTGPIIDQSGKVAVPAGYTLQDSEVFSCQWFVEGVIGSE